MCALARPAGCGAGPRPSVPDRNCAQAEAAWARVVASPGGRGLSSRRVLRGCGLRRPLAEELDARRDHLVAFAPLARLGPPLAVREAAATATWRPFARWFWQATASLPNAVTVT